MSRKHTLLIIVVAGFAGIPAANASFLYGNRNGTTVEYQQITEDSSTDPGVALFGSPSISGDTLLFNPVSFGISAMNGGFDFMDGTFTTTLVSIGNNRIEKIQFNEYGDWTLLGNGTAGTNATVTNTLFVRITDIDGVGAFTPFTTTASMTFSPSNGSYNLIANRGQGLVWQGNVLVDVDAILAANGYAGRQARKVNLTFDNALSAFSEVGTIAYIKKKEIDGIAITTYVPEPATFGLLLLGGLVLRRRP